MAVDQIDLTVASPVVAPPMSLPPDAIDLTATSPGPTTVPSPPASVSGALDVDTAERPTTGEPALNPTAASPQTAGIPSPPPPASEMQNRDRPTTGGRSAEDTSEKLVLRIDKRKATDSEP
jgi:hypothetical protein